MSRARIARGIGFFAATAWLMAAFFWRPWTVEGLALGIGGAAALSALGERAFQRLAGTAEKRADLEDRVRNPPA